MFLESPLRGRVFAAAVGVCAVLAIAACHDSSSAPRSASYFYVVSGDSQSATVAGAEASPVVVHASDVSGAGVPGLPVTFAVSSGGGTLSTSSATTDASGDAQTTWTLGTTAGTQTVTATAGSLAPITITATALAGPAASITKVSGDSSTAAENTSLSSPIVVMVVDSYGNPVSGATVNWTVTSGGGTLDVVSSTTGTDGKAQANWTLGPNTGAQTVTATVGSLAPITFTAIGT
jgi:hypothetical protein